MPPLDARTAARAGGGGSGLRLPGSDVMAVRAARPPPQPLSAADPLNFARIVTNRGAHATTQDGLDMPNVRYGKHAAARSMQPGVRPDPVTAMMKAAAHHLGGDPLAGFHREDGSDYVMDGTHAHAALQASPGNMAAAMDVAARRMRGDMIDVDMETETHAEPKHEATASLDAAVAAAWGGRVGEDFEWAMGQQTRDRVRARADFVSGGFARLAEALVRRDNLRGARRLVPSREARALLSPESQLAAPPLGARARLASPLRAGGGRELLAGLYG